MPQLDALRAFAVTLVVVHHYSELVGVDITRLKLGFVGVNIFFVLSGFLITGILLREKVALSGRVHGLAQTMGRFYARRSLRIFPLYYMVVLVAILASIGSARENALWLLTCTFNIKMVFDGWFDDYFAHFWSLCVEEQFYLVWPILILAVPRRLLPLAIVIMIAIGPVTRALYVVGWNFYDLADSLGSFILTPACLDSLGLGALLAYSGQSDPRMWRLFGWPAAALGAIGLAFAGLLDLAFPEVMATAILGQTLSGLMFASAIRAAALGTSGAAGRLMDWAPVKSLGVISYGVYIYHPFIPIISRNILDRLHLGRVPAGYDVVLFVLITLLVSTLSWVAFERPINALKDRLAPAATRARQGAQVTEPAV